MVLLVNIVGLYINLCRLERVDALQTDDRQKTTQK